MGLRNFQTHLQCSIEQCEWCGPHERRELCRGGRYEHSGGLYVGMHARSLGLEGERGIRRGKGERVGSNSSLDLGDRGLYDVGEGLHLRQGI